MIFLKNVSPLLLMFVLLQVVNVVVSREPLFNSQGRFKYVDKVQTITFNESVIPDTHPLFRRDVDDFPYCRGRCSGAKIREGNARRKRSLESEGYLRSAWRSMKTALAKRRFAPNSFLQWSPTDIADWMKTLLEADNFIWVFYADGRINGVERDENTARFRELGDTAFDMGLEGLCGCTILVVVSRRAVYFAHFFESLSWAPDELTLNERGNPTLEDNFQRSVINFLSTGKDWDVGEVNQNAVLGDQTAFFRPEFGTRAFILTPQNQDAPQDAGVPVNKRTNYLEGLLYQNLVDVLIASVRDLLGVTPSAFTYQALDGTASALDKTTRGKAIFQYDPLASRGRNPDRGSRLLLQGMDIDITLGGRRMKFPRGVVYEDYWQPGGEVVNPGENRFLSDSPIQTDSSSKCGGQVYNTGNYTCYGDFLCPILDGVPTLLCGVQCYLESLYTCYDSFLCPVIDGVPTLRCGEDCYLPGQYSCESSKLVQILHSDDDSQQSSSPNQSGNPTQSGNATQSGNPNQSGDSKHSQNPTSDHSGSPITVPTPSTTWSTSLGVEVVFDGTVYTISTQPTTLTSSGRPIILGPGGLTIGSDIIPLPLVTGAHTAITTDGIIFTVWPPGQHVSPISPSSTAAPGPSPTSVIPSPTTTQTSDPIPSSTVITITAIDSSSTTEVTFTPSTLAPFTTLTSTSTIITNIDGVPTTIVIGPGGVAWVPKDPGASTSGFPPIPFPSLPPSPGSTGTGISPTETSKSSPSGFTPTVTSNPFPSSQFTTPVVITTTITTDGSEGPTITTIIGTTDSSGFVKPITVMSTAEAILSAKSLSSRIVSASSIIAAYSANPANSASASSAVSAIETAHAGGNSFGSGLGISLPGLCWLFCGSAGGIASRLEDILALIPNILGGSSQPSEITWPLNELGRLANDLGEKAEEASHSSDSTGSPVKSCTGTVLTNCDVFCVAPTISNPGGSPTTSSCYSTTCSVETQCGGAAVTSTSYDYMYCPTEQDETMSLYSYQGYTFDPITSTMEDSDDLSSTIIPTSTSESTPSDSATTTSSVTTSTTTTESTTSTTSQSTTTSSPSPTPTSRPPDHVSNCYRYSYTGPDDGETCASFAEKYDITVPQLFDWNYSLQPADGSQTCELSTAWNRGTRSFCIGVRDDSTTSPTKTVLNVMKGGIAVASLGVMECWCRGQIFALVIKMDLGLGLLVGASRHWNCHAA